MANPFRSFRPETIDPTKLEQILSRYLAYERVRWFRSLLVRRFAVLLLTWWVLTSVLQLLPFVAMQRR